MKDLTQTTLGYTVPVKGYSSINEIVTSAGGEQKAVDRINALLITSHAGRLKGSVVQAIVNVVGEKPAKGVSPEKFTGMAKGKEEEVKKALQPVTLSILPQPIVRVKKVRPVPPAWLKEAGELLKAQGKDKLIAMLAARGHKWTPDTTQALDQGANLESLGRIVQALHVNPLGL